MIHHRWLTLLLLPVFGCGDNPSTSSSSSSSSSSTPPSAPGKSYSVPKDTWVTVGEAGSARIEFDHASLKEDVVVEIGQEAPGAVRDSSARTLGPIWNLRVNGSDHYEFAGRVTLSLPYDPGKITAGTRVFMSTWDGTRWRRVDSEPRPLRRIVQAKVNHFSKFKLEADGEGIRFLNRYYGSSTYTKIVPDSFSHRLQPGSTGFTETRELKWAFREEYDERLATTRIVHENLSWAYSHSASKWVEGSAGDREWTRDEEVRVGGSWGEKELNSGVKGREKEELEEKKGELKKAEEELAKLEEEYRKAESNKGEKMTDHDHKMLLAKLESRHLAKLWEVGDLARRIRELEFISERKMGGGYVSYEKDGAGKLTRISLGCFFSVYPVYKRTTWTLSVLEASGKTVSHTKHEGEYSFVEKSPSLDAAPGESWKQSVKTDHGDYGTTEETHEYHGTTEIPEGDREVILRGAVSSRLRIPEGEKDSSLIKSESDWSRESAIPMEGVRVAAWLTDPGPSLPLSGLPDNLTRSGADGAFELPMLLLPKKVIVLQVRYRNKGAQIEENQWVVIPTDKVRSRKVDEGGDDAIGDLTRSGRVTVRYAMSAKDLDLGSEERGGVLRRRDGKLLLEFEKSNSLFVNTFVYRATHVNQNRAGFTLKGVYFPRAEIEAATATWPAVERDRAKERMGKDDVTEVDLRGWEICYPSSTLMALDCLGLETASESRVGALAQAIYGQHPRPNPLPENHTWLFPIQFHLPYNLNWMARRNARLWPFIGRNNDGKEKCWLISVRDPKGHEWRPWQVTAIFFPAVRAFYPGKLRLFTEMGDVFDGSKDQRIIDEFARGAAGTVSISHLGYYKGGGTYRGTHKLALVGAVVSMTGKVVRLIFHDPYGDLTRSPGTEGYYGTPRDVDDTGHDGAYVPYGGAPFPIKAYDGTLKANYWNIYRPVERPTPAGLRKRLLPSEG